MAKVKYLGTADEASLEKGEDFGGRLSTPLASRVVFNRGNNFMVDSEDAGLSDDAVELLVEDSDRFKNVSDMKRIPSSLHEQIFLGHKASSAADNEEPTVEDDTAKQATPQNDASLVTGGGPVTTTGGSTAGDTTGGGTGGAGGAVGGSTKGGR